MRPPTGKPLIDPPFEAPPQLPEDEVATQEAENATERVLSEIRGASQWGVVECLLWLGLRDHSQMTERIALWESASGGSASGVSEATLLRMTLRSLEILDAASGDPVGRLVALLKEGSLKATGRHLGTGARQEIPLLEWIDLTFTAGTGDLADRVVATTRPSVEGNTFWSDIRFDRNSVEGSHLGSPGNRPNGWRDVPTHPMKLFVCDPSVEDEAISRINEKAERLTERAICGVIKLLALEINPSFRSNEKSIAATRRENGCSKANSLNEARRNSHR